MRKQTGIKKTCNKTKKKKKSDRKFIEKEENNMKNMKK